MLIYCDAIFNELRNNDFPKLYYTRIKYYTYKYFGLGHFATVQRN